MTPEELCHEYPKTPKFEGYNDCIIGVIDRYGMEQPILLYSAEMVIEKLLEIPGIRSREEALTFFHQDYLGSWVGEGTPAFLLDEIH